jgi:hypothetical protein
MNSGSSQLASSDGNPAGNPARDQGPDQGPESRSIGSLPQGRSPLAHLLHALHQPLTGLQCSMELAVAGPRRPEQYVRTLQEGLDLTLRMRLLVEAIGELASLEQDEIGPGDPFPLDVLLRETVDDLRPVAESRQVRLLAACDAGLAVRFERRFLATQAFRLLESALSLAGPGSDLRLTAVREQEQAVLVVAWTDGPPPEHSPFSRPDLGLLIAQAGWVRSGAEWGRTRDGDRQSCTVRMPLTSSQTHSLTHEPC